MFSLSDLLYSFLALTGLYILISKIYVSFTRGKCTSNKDMTGKVVVITGANTGIGLECARDISRRNAKVILACRNLDRGKAAAEEIMLSTGNTKVIVKQLDVSSFKSIRVFVDEFMKTETRLDVLINNAGMIGPPTRQLTEDGIELQFATNHMGPFLLTMLLLPLLKKTAPSRIVMVSSLAHEFGVIDFKNLNAELKYDPGSIYCNTKLANILFTAELNRRLEGCGVTVNALHPGMIASNLGREVVGWRRIVITIFHYLALPFFRNAEEGAQTSIYLAVSEEVEGMSGKYFIECKEFSPSKLATDKTVARELWEVSEQVSKLAQ